MTDIDVWAADYAPNEAVSDDPPGLDLAWDRTWQPVDLSDVLAGRYKRPEASIGRRMDGIGILYPSKVHTLASESEAGKTWLALELAAQELRDGRDVVYIDFEDDAGGVVGRLLTMQTDPELIAQHFRYVRPTTPIGSGINVDDLRRAMTPATTLAIIDGITEAMTLHGFNPLDNADVAEFGRKLPRWLANQGAAVLCLDHVTKDKETRGRYAIGGVHKLNALDGAAFILENRTAFGVGVTGRSTLRIAKDRPGQLRRHALPAKGGLHWFADLVVESHTEDWAEVTIEAATERADDFRPTYLMAKIYRFIADNAGEDGVSGRHVQNVLKGNAGTNRQAMSLLELGGHITKSPHKPLTPYVNDQEAS